MMPDSTISRYVKADLLAALRSMSKHEETFNVTTVMMTLCAPRSATFSMEEFAESDPKHVALLIELVKRVGAVRYLANRTHFDCFAHPIACR